MHETGRINLATTAPFSVGVLRVEPALRQVSTAASEAETLEPRVMLVLVALARADGGIVSRDQLIEQCWDSRVVGDDSINRVISRLRKLAGPHGDDAVFSIETISKVGYRLVSNPADAAEPEASGAAAPVASGLPAIVNHSLRARPLVIAATAALAIVAVVAGVSLWPASAANDGVAELAITTSAGPGTPPGVAQTLHDEMASVFGPERLRIVDASRSDVDRLTAKVSTIAGEQVVFGELRPPGNGPAIWSSRITVRDAHSLKGVAAHLMWTASCAVNPEVTRAPVNLSPVAVSAWASSCEENSSDHPSVLKQIEDLHMAVKAEPRFVTAQLRLAANLGQGLPGRATAESEARRAEGRHAIDIAEGLKPNDYRIHIMRYYLAAENDFAGQENELGRALQTPGPTGEVYQAHGYFLDSTGRFEASINAHQRRLAIQPSNPIDKTWVANMLAASGSYQEAREIYAQEARIRSDAAYIRWFWLYSAIAAHDWENAVKLKSAERGDKNRAAVSKLIDGLAAGNAAEVSEAGAEFEALAADPANLSPSLAQGLGFSNRPVAALKAISEMFDMGGRSYLRVLFMPALAPARQTPEFAAFVTRIGLVDYWRKSGNLPDFCLSPGAPALCATLRRRG